MLKNNKIKILCLLIIGIVFLYIYGPIAFMKDGLVTRQSVNSFDELYELGPTRRHKCENGTRIYIVYFGWSAPKVKKEIVYQKNEETQKQIVDVDKKKKKNILINIYLCVNIYQSIFQKFQGI